MSKEEFLKEINELKAKMIKVSDRHGNVSKFEVTVEIVWEDLMTIIDYKKVNDG